MNHASRASRTISRRTILKAAGALAAPAIVPATVLGKNAPSNRIQIGCIGVGRMGTGDLHDVIAREGAQIVAVCDLDSWRVQNAKQVAEKFYAKRSANGAFTGVDTCGDFRDIVARPDIDMVQISTPDHWHAIPAIAAAQAGKDIFIQKPFTYTVEEGRMLADTVRRYGRVLQVGSQQRSEQNFRFACELVRNGRLGRVHTVQVGLPTDMAGPVRQPTAPPPELDYEFWLGPTPWTPFIEDRVHPPKNISGRPGWLRVQEYCLGMITGWGAHHNDIAQWGLGTEDSGPVEVVGRADYPDQGIWDVHIGFHVEYTYANGVKLICADTGTNRVGVRFEGTEGWVWVSRGQIEAEPVSLLRTVIRPEEIHLPQSNHHKQNLLDCIRSRATPVAPAEVAHRSNTVCVLGHIAMKLAGARLKWDPKQERFTNSDEANRMLSRANRAPWHA